jgi:hypothetical protein
MNRIKQQINVARISSLLLVLVGFTFQGSFFSLFEWSQQVFIHEPKRLSANNNPTEIDQSKTVVLADPTDPYYDLAEEIAQSEKLLLFHDLNEALDSQPVYLIWVVSPKKLSSQAFTHFAEVLSSRAMVVSSGIISGSTLDSARALWNRTLTDNGKHIAIIPREDQIYWLKDNQVSFTPLNKQNFIEAFQQVDYVTYQGHGASRQWMFDETDETNAITAKDIPELPPMLVNALSCQTFKPWIDDSIALGFTDRGAAAYIGFIQTPQGYPLGEPKGFSYYYSWPDFPIGTIVQAQNHAFLQGFLSWPFYFLMGDPRESFQKESPYRLNNDQTEGNKRILSISGAPAGVIPLYIPDGAGYSFVSIAGIASAADNDPFYNPNLQTTNIGADKYLLLNHQGGDFSVILYKNPPWYHFFTSILIASLDHTTVIVHSEGSFWFNIIIVGIALLVFIGILWRKKYPLRPYWLGGIIAGLALALFRAGYAIIRQAQLADLYTNRMRTMDVAYDVNYWYVIVSLGMAICAAWVYFNTPSRWKKAFILIAVTLPGPILEIYLMAVMLFVNILAKKSYGITLYKYGQETMALITIVIELLIFCIPLFIFNRYYKRRKNNPQ